MAKLNKYLLVLAVIFALSTTYLLGRSNKLSKNIEVVSETTPAVKAVFTTASQPEITQKPIIKTPSIVKTPGIERKKVAVTLSDPIISGTYYCYEDKANEIMTTQNNINLALKTFNMCMDNARNNLNNCFSNCSNSYHLCTASCSSDLACINNCGSQQTTCSSSCSTSNDCGKYGSDVDNYRNQLINLKRSNCP